MPELPEVETIRRVLEPQLVGRRVTSVSLLNARVIAYPDRDDFIKMFSGQVVQKMSRRGKYLTIRFESGDRLAVHLRMTGQLLVTPGDYEMEKHTHLIAGLSDGNQLRYIDVRRFGRFWYLKKDEADSVTGQEKLGLEPDDDNLTALYLKSRLCKRKKSIKEMLLDQTFIAGIGNIYSDEILYEAGIYPGAKGGELSDEDIARLVKVIPKVISFEISANETTEQEYLADKGQEYRNTPYLKAYGHAGRQCPVCGEIFKKIKIAGRGSCYCPGCQRKRN